MSQVWLLGIHCMHTVTVPAEAITTSPHQFPQGWRPSLVLLTYYYHNNTLIKVSMHTERCYIHPKVDISMHSPHTYCTRSQSTNTLLLTPIKASTHPHMQGLHIHTFIPKSPHTQYAHTHIHIHSHMNYVIHARPPHTQLIIRTYSPQGLHAHTAT